MTRPPHRIVHGAAGIRVNCFVGGRSPRVWSLLVTTFGDLAQGESAELSSGMLGSIMALVGLKPESVRVALHRLRRDGWIDSRRVGRQVRYRLTDTGRAESAAASRLIYSARPLADKAWLVLVDPETGATGAAGNGVWVAPTVLLTSNPDAHGDALRIPLDAAFPLPDWMARRVCDARLQEQASDLATRLGRLDELISGGPCPGPVEAATLRVLIVHDWRRIVLKLPCLPDHVYPRAWQGPACREKVAALLECMPRPELDNLSADAAS